VVRTDKNLNSSFSDNDKWTTPDSNRFTVKGRDENGEWFVQSFSGQEKNRLFMSKGASSFKDLSVVSGLDSQADGRAFAIWDYNRDGWQDLLLANANFPQLEIYSNLLHQKKHNSNRIAFRLIGGNNTPKPSKDLSNRDAIGAQIRVKCGSEIFLRELRCSEGFASQNSNTIVIGIGNHQSIDEVEISWPAGKKQNLKNLPLNHLVTVSEGDSAALKTEPLQTPKDKTSAQAPAPPIDFAKIIGHDSEQDSNAKYFAYITTATWCSSCKQSLPQLSLLKEKFGDQVEFFGLPVDVDDTPEKLQEYQSAHSPPYQLLENLKESKREDLSRLIRQELGQEVLPTLLLSDAEGKLLGTHAGPPSISWLAEKLTKSKR